MSEPGPKRSRRSSILVGVLLVLIVLVVWRVLSFEPFIAARRLSGELAKARAEGLYTSLSDLPPAPGVKTGNAASTYREMSKAITPDRWQKLADVRIAVRSHDPKDRAKAEASRPALEPLVAKLEEGTRMPHVDFGHDPKSGYLVDFKDETVLVAMATLLRWDAQEAASRRDVETALSKADEIAKVAGQLDDEQFLSVAGFRAHVLLDLFSVLEPIVHDSGGLPSVRLRVRRILDETGPVPDYRTLLARELPAALSSVDRADEKAWKATAPEFAVFGNIRSSAKIPVFRDAFKTRIIEFWRAAYLEMPKDRNDLQGVQRALWDAQAKQEGKEEFSYTLSKVLYDAYASDIGAFNSSEGRVLLLRAALGWIEGKRDLPVDPNSGKPMRHKVVDGNEILYAVGPDGKDDGGSQKHGLADLPVDIVVRLPKV